MLLLSLALLSSCQVRTPNDSQGDSSLPVGDYYYDQVTSGYLTSQYGTKGKIRIQEKASFTSLFNTSLTLRIYHQGEAYDEKKLNEISQLFNDSMSYYHALTDRHYHYEEKDKEGKDVLINNVAVLNESYGTGKAVSVDPFLFDVLRKSVDFALSSDLRFNPFIGSVNDIYEEKLGTVGSDFTPLDYALSMANGFAFSSDVDEKAIKTALAYLPKTKEEVKSLLSFDEKNHTVTFHALEGTESNSLYRPVISLGGNAKGFATEKMAEVLEEKYPDTVFLLDSGSSSFKTVGVKENGTPWGLLMRNPLFDEAGKVVPGSLYNAYEVGISLPHAFNLSTSGYGEQHFYVYHKASDIYLRRDHIVNPKTGYSTSYFDQISVVNDDAGLADMMTTALMTTASVKEALSLYKSLNEIYAQQDSHLILVFKSLKNNPLERYQYRHTELSPLREDGYPVLADKNGKEYQGSYDTLNRNNITDYTVKSFASRAFKETYLYTADLKGHIQLKEGQEHMKAVLKEIEA